MELRIGEKVTLTSGSNSQEFIVARIERPNLSLPQQKVILSSIIEEK